jgi:hypothetical protein
MTTILFFHSFIPESPLFFIGFILFKFICYSLFVWTVFPRFYKGSQVNPVLIAGIRTILGTVLGTSLYYLMRFVSTHGLPLSISPIIPLIDFMLLRALEWYIIIWYFYDRQQTSKLKIIKLSLLSMLFSLLMDIPSFLFGYVFTRDMTSIIF